jgi:hypothetical protein
MTLSESYTRWLLGTDEDARDELAANLEEAAKLIREAKNLTPVSGHQFLYARAGTPEERRAAVDAWAAQNHVEAAERPDIGYCAKVTLGPVTVMAVAKPAHADLGSPVSRELETAAAA